MNEAVAVCECSLKFCQKGSEGYVLMYLLPTHFTTVHALVSENKQFSSLPKMHLPVDKANGSLDDCTITIFWTPFKSLQTDTNLLSHMVLNEIRLWNANNPDFFLFPAATLTAETTFKHLTVILCVFIIAFLKYLWWRAKIMIMWVFNVKSYKNKFKRNHAKKVLFVSF